MKIISANITGSLILNNVDISSVTGSQSSINSLNSKTGSYATTGSNAFIGQQNINGSVAVTGSLTTTGTIVAQTLNVQQVTSSVVYSSGSNVFGNSLSNTQQFTGSLQVTGSAHYLLGSVGINNTNGTVGVLNASGRIALTSGLFFSSNLTSEDRWEINGSNSSYLGFVRSGVNEYMRITSGGNVLIGTTTDSGYKLDVNGTGRFSGNVAINGSANSLDINPTSGLPNITLRSGNTFRGYIEGNSSGGLSFGAGAAANIYLTITSGGNVGIGTASPATAKLEVFASIPSLFTADSQANTLTYGGSIFYRNHTGAGEGNGIAFNLNNASNNRAEYAYIGGIIQTNTAGSENGAILFATTSSGARTERMRITSGGNVVVGGTTAGTVLSTSITVNNATAANFAGFIPMTANTERGYYAGSSSGLEIGVAGSGTFDIYTGGSIRARITSGGNVLIGTTTDSGEKFQVTGGRIYANGTGTSSGITWNNYNIYQDASANLIYRYGTTEIFKFAPTGAATFTSTATQALGFLSSGTTPYWYFQSTGAGGSTAYLGFGSSLTTGAASTDFIIRSENALAFNTNGNNERMRITSGGNVGIFDNAPAYKLSINNGTAALTTAHFWNYVGDQTATTFILKSARPDILYHMQIFNNNTTECFRIEANGNVKNTNSSYGSLSDIKIKENISDATPKLEDLLKVRIRNYNIIGQEVKQIGVIAQELEEIFPSMVDENQDRDNEGNLLETTTKGVKYSVFIPILIKAIQEQQAQIEELKLEVDLLKNK